MRMHLDIVGLLTCAALACVAYSGIACNGGSGSSTYVTKVPPVGTLSAVAKPEWEAPLTTEPRPQQQPSEVAVHLDISYPMAGFLPRESDSSDLSALQLVAQNVAQHMARVYGGSEVAVKWYGVGHEVRELSPTPRIQRELFDGRSTRLDLSIKNILSNIQSGYMEAAAIVSDLMATGEVTGPLFVSAQLSEWLETNGVRSGEFHVGLFGVKAEYQGITHPPDCPPGSRLGCWFDERVKKYKPLESASFLPIYVLVFGRGAEAVTSLMKSLERGVDEMNQYLEFQSELVTRNSHGFDTNLSCGVGPLGDDGKRERQYALVVDQDEMYTCVRDATVTLDCAFAGGEDSLVPARGRTTWSSTSTDPTSVEVGNGTEGIAPPEPTVRVDPSARRIEVDVDCSSIRNSRTDLQLALEVSGSANRLTKDWSGWSTEVAALGKTLNLNGFVEAVRINPDRYRVELPVILRFSGG